MEVRLLYRYGRITPELRLSSEEATVFRECQIPAHISHIQIMMGLGEQNPRYPRSTSRCESYQPLEPLAREQLEIAANYIYRDFQTLLEQRNRPPLDVRASGPVGDQENELVHSLNVIFPLSEEREEVDDVHMVVNGRVWRLQPLLVGTRDAYTRIREEWEGRFSAYRGSTQSQIDAMRQEYESQITRLRDQMGRNLSLPHNLTRGRLQQHNMIFYTCEDRLSRGDMYWFQIPFKLRSSRIRVGQELKRIKPELRMINDGFLTLGFGPQGRLNNSHRLLSGDRNLENGINHCHRQSGLSFCSGTFAEQRLDLTSPNIPDQVVAIRNAIQDLLSIVNPESFGRNLGGHASTISSLWRGTSRDRRRIYMTPEEVEAEDARITGGEEPQGGREWLSLGTGSIWQVDASDVPRPTAEPRRRTT